jgi:alkylated DNA repair dioxygenase AlkB
MLLILSGEARYDWTHEIPARKSDVINGARQPRTRRVSLTFRTVTL